MKSTPSDLAARLQIPIVLCQKPVVRPDDLVVSTAPSQPPLFQRELGLLCLIVRQEGWSEAWVEELDDGRFTANAICGKVIEVTP